MRDTPTDGKPDAHIRFTVRKELDADVSLSSAVQPYKCHWENCDELFGRRSMLLAHVRARHDGTVKMRVVQSPGGTHQVAEVVGWNGYRTCVAVTPRKGRGRTREESAHEGEDEEGKNEWGAEWMYGAPSRPKDHAEEEKALMDGNMLPSTDDGLLYWPANDMQDEYKEVGDSLLRFSTFPSLPSPRPSPPLSTSSSFQVSYSLPAWASQNDDGGAGGYFAAPLSVPSSVWSNPPPVPDWQPARFNTAPLHNISAAPSPLFASPMHSPRLSHDRADSDDPYFRSTSC